MADLEKIIKECRYDRVDLNKNLDKSNKFDPLLQSEAMTNANNVFRRSPINKSSPTNISTRRWGEGGA